MLFTKFKYPLPVYCKSSWQQSRLAIFLPHRTVKQLLNPSPAGQSTFFFIIPTAEHFFSRCNPTIDHLGNGEWAPTRHNSPVFIPGRFVNKTRHFEKNNSEALSWEIFHYYTFWSSRLSSLLWQRVRRSQDVRRKLQVVKLCETVCEIQCRSIPCAFVILWLSVTKHKFVWFDWRYSCVVCWK